MSEIPSAVVPASVTRPGRPARSARSARWGRRLGVLSAAFFLLKGLAWLAIAAAAASGLV